MSLLYDAMMFAREVHKDQRRKHSGNPYVEHLAEVAGIVATVTNDEVTIASAWLHDCMEDQGVQRQTLVDRFGEQVAIGVVGLSDMEKGNRAQRKAASRARLAVAPGWVQTVKCADIISNTPSISIHDPDFAKIYRNEARLLLDVMTEADGRLRRLACDMLMHVVTR